MKPAVLQKLADTEKLIDLYLNSSPKDRNKLFAPAARVAERLGVTQRTVQYWVENGSLQCINIGHRRLVYLKSLGAFLTKNLVAPKN
ncbi:MAG: helix-turn-helix domain-containing protein [Blastocatellia bacterium]|nr:helix-turn-helix domain-containing protein [Blastocatellia bacterium]